MASVVLPVLLAACGTGGGDEGAEPAITLTFEASEAPDIFQREGTGRRTSSAAAGSWAVVQGLRRPESAVVRNLATGAEVTVALFAGRPAGGAAAELSGDAADSLGIGEAPAQVRVTVVRDEPQVSLRR